MKFEEALAAMREGKVVCRPDRWTVLRYHITKHGLMHAKIKSNSGRWILVRYPEREVIAHEDIMADDWQIVAER